MSQLEDAMNQIEVVSIINKTTINRNKFCSTYLYHVSSDIYISISEADDNIILFVLGALAGGICGYTVSCASITAAMHMIMHHFNIHVYYRKIVSFLVYLFFFIAYYFNMCHIYVFGAFQLGQTLQEYLQHRNISKKCFALIFISLNLIIYDTKFNLVLIFLSKIHDITINFPYILSANAKGR